jgi:hypothetical protein
LSFIPALVIAEAARLYGKHRRWSAVLELLRAGGNGTYARNTLIRRVTLLEAGQNSAGELAGGGRGRAARAASRISPNRRGERASDDDPDDEGDRYPGAAWHAHRL